MPSASSPALSRVASPNHTCCVVARGGAGRKGAGVWGVARCKRLVTSTGELHWAHSHVSRVQAGMLLPGRRILEGPGSRWEENRVIKWAAGVS